MFSTTPVSPEQRSRTDSEGMEQHTHPARLCRLRAMPLTPLAEPTGAAVADPGGIDDAQTAPLFFAPFLGKEGFASRAAHRPVWLEGKILSREAPGFPGPADRRLAIALLWGLLLVGLGYGRCKLGGAHGRRLKPMTQFEAQGRDPLVHDLPCLLPSGRMRTPAIRVLLGVFIGKLRLEGSTMQVKGDHIGSREGTLRKVGEEQLVDGALARVADAALCFASRMGRHHDPAVLSLRSHSDIGTIVEGAHQRTFRARELLIGRQMQAGLDLGPIQDRVVFATHHEQETSQIGEHGSRTILSI
jgi:hypothetical protein